MKMSSKKPKTAELVKVGEFNILLPSDQKDLERFVSAVAERDTRIVKRMRGLQRANEELSERTEALETALVKIIQQQGLIRQGGDHEGEELIRRATRDINRHCL